MGEWWHRHAALCRDGRSDVTESDVTDLTDVPDLTGDLVGLFGAAKCVLFDFDGPVCHLFDGHPASGIAAELRIWAARNVPGDVVVEAGSVDDPLALLRAAALMYPDSDLVKEMEQQLTSQELRATLTAEPTEDADLLIRRPARPDSGSPSRRTTPSVRCGAISSAPAFRISSASTFTAASPIRNS